MARQFGFPNVAALEVGGSCVVNATVSEVKRKCGLYAARNGKRFVVVKEVIDAHGPALVARVTRLPVTDAELPSAA